MPEHSMPVSPENISPPATGSVGDVSVGAKFNSLYTHDILTVNTVLAGPKMTVSYTIY
jgi:hypothetical protein